MFKLLGYLLTGQWNRFKAEVGMFGMAYMAAPDYPAAMNIVGNNMAANIAPAIVASATQITVDYAMTVVSGTTGITTIKVRTGFRGILVLIPTGAMVLTSGGTYVASDGTYEVIPIKVSKTTAAGVPVILFCDGNFLYAVLSA